MSEFKLPEFLSEADKPVHRVRCPIHGFIPMSDNERQVLDHRLMRRLRFIRQLGLTEYAYPGANHTRLEHSLGVMHLATRAFDVLLAKHGKTLSDVFGEVDGLSMETLARCRQLLRVAALVHDIGHAPFSHAAEGVLHGDEGHEALSVRIVESPELLGGLLDDLWGAGTSAWIGRLLRGGTDLPPQVSLLREIVAGELDADRTDYLLRDSHHCGVDYGRFDHRRLIESLTVEQPAEGGLRMALHRDGIHAFEALILARYQMSAQVYFHKIRRIYDRYLEEYHRLLADEVEMSQEFLLANNDATMLARILQDAARTPPGERKQDDRIAIAKRITERDHHRVVLESGADADLTHVRAAAQAVEVAKNKYTDVHFLEDQKPVTIHKLWTPGSQQDETGAVWLSVVDNQGHSVQVGKESQILGKIPKRFNRVRVFADVKDKDRRKAIESELDKEYRRHL